MAAEIDEQQDVPVIRIHPTKREAIRERMREDYYNLHGKGSYEVVGGFWEITGGMAHRIINNDNYFPKDPRILRVLRKKAEEFNLGIKGR